MAFVRGGRGERHALLTGRLNGVLEYDRRSFGWMDGGRGRLAASSSFWI